MNFLCIDYFRLTRFKYFQKGGRVMKKFILSLCSGAILMQNIPIYVLAMEMEADTTKIDLIKEQQVSSILSAGEDNMTINESNPQLISNQNLVSVIHSVQSQTKSQQNLTSETQTEKEDSYSTDEQEAINKEETPSFSSLQEYSFDIYDEKNENCIVSLKLNPQQVKWNVEVIHDLTFNSTYPDELAYKLFLYNENHELKQTIDLYGKDNGEKLVKELHEVAFKVGDYIQFLPIHSPQTLRVNGSLTGDISIEQEDYSDGVDDEDYIYNVRFEIMENEIKTVYNQQPIFEGLVDYQWTSEETIDPLVGIKVTDDHDGVIDLSKIRVEELQNNDEFVEYEYTVVDSWERVTTGKRIIYKKAPVSSPETNQSETNSMEQDAANDDFNMDNLIPIVRPNVETLVVPAAETVNRMERSRPSYTNEIIVDGVRYAAGATKRLTIGIDANKILRLVYQDGLLFNPSVKEAYFKLGVYNSNMDRKLFVEVLGTDRSDSEKLSAIDGFKLAEGDYISIWMYEPETNLKMIGTIQNKPAENTPEASSSDNSNNNFTANNPATGIPADYLENHRFQYNGGRLESVENTAPQFVLTLPQMTIQRGQQGMNFLDILQKSSENSSTSYIEDDHETFDEDSYKRGDIQLTYTEVNVNKAGIQEITYTATDKWGASSTATRQVLVTGDASLDKTSIQVYAENIDRTETETEKLGLTITFDHISRTINVAKANGVTQLNPNNSDMQFRFRIYSKDGILKKNFTVKGTDELTARLLANIDGYQYLEGDRISLSTSNLESVKIIAPPTSNVETKEGSEQTDQSGESSSALQTYIFTQDKMTNGRLVLNGDVLGYEYNEAPVITWKNGSREDEKIIVKRGETINYEDYFTVTDTIDDDLGKKPSTKANVLDTTQLGQYTVKYQATDSWGRTSAKLVTVEIVEKNELEKSTFVFENLISNKQVLEISFDDIENHLVAQSLDLSDAESEEKVFTLVLYTKDGAFKNKVEVHNNTTLEDLNAKLAKITYENTDMLRIGIHSTDYNVSFNNYKIYQREQLALIEDWAKPLYNGVFASVDEIENTRFVLNENGLIKVYDQENPGIKYEESENRLPAIYIVKDSTNVTREKFYENIKIIDYLYGELESNETNTEIALADSSAEWEHINQTVGTYRLNYTFKDTWGRTTELTRNLFIVSKASENSIEFKSGGNAFLTLKFDSTKDGFDVQVTSLSEASAVDVSQSEDTDSNVSSGATSYKLGIYDSNGNTIKEFDIPSPNVTRNTSTEEVTFKQIIEELKAIEIRTGYYISVWAADANNLNITGTISVSESHPIPNNSSSETNEYDQDVMENTRFKITDNGLEAVYNTAPQVTFEEWDALLAGTEIPLSSGVNITDDHDNGTTYDEYTVTIQYQFISDSSAPSEEDSDSSNNQNCSQPSDDPYCLKIGSNKIFYTVTDSWGRSTTKARELTINNGLHRNIITIDANAVSDGPSGSPDVLALGFDTNTNTIRLEIDPAYPNAKIRTAQAKTGLRFTLYGSDGTQKQQRNINGEQLISELRSVNGWSFDYGDYLHIQAAMPIYTHIYETVLNARENYTDGFDNPLNLTSAYFKITKSGLEAYYKESQSVNTENNDTVIAPVAPEEIPIQFKISPSAEGIGGTITKQNGTTNTLWWNEDQNIVFEMRIYRKIVDGNYTAVRELTNVIGRTKGEDISWEDFNYQDGDYIVIWHKYPHMLTLYGNTYDEQGNKIDLTNGIEQTEPRDIVFKLAEGKVTAVHNYAPEIEGFKINGSEYSIDILESQVEEFKSNCGFTSNMTITDDRDSSTLNSDRQRYVEIEPIQELKSSSSVLGAHHVRYTVTDTWGRSTSYDVTINVRTDVSNNYFNMKSYDNDNTVLFKLGFDSITQKYVVFDQVSTAFTMDASLAFENVLEIRIKGSNGEQKAHVTLLGSDRGTSSKLDKLNDVTYAEDDIIRISSLKFTNSSAIMGAGYTINGILSYPQGNISEIQPLSNGITTDKIQPLPDDINVIDYVKNIGYVVKADGLIAYYNHAPTITINSNQGSNESVYEVYRGTTYQRSIFTANDVEDRILTEQVKFYVNGNLITDDSYTFNIIGTQQVRLQVTDSWGRTTVKEFTINVKSKMEQNQIEIGTGDINGTFAMTFDIETNRIILTPISQPSSQVIPITSSDSLTIRIRNKFGEVAEEITLIHDVDENRQLLARLNARTYSLYETLEFETTNSSLVQFKGDMVGSDNNSTVDISAQRYQITDYGLKILTKPSVSVTLKDVVTVKRGENVNPFEGITVTGLNENTRDLQIKWVGVVPNTPDTPVASHFLLAESDTNTDSDMLLPESPELVIDSTVEGQYTVKTVFVDSWGNKIEKENKVKIVPRDNIDSVKFKVKNGNQEVITLALDSIESSMRIVSEPSIITPRTTPSVLTTIAGYDLVGNKVAEIVVKSDSTAELLKEGLEQFNLEEIESISVISSDSSNVEVTGNISLSDSLKQQQNKLLIRDKQQDLMTNTRLILDGATNSVEAVYNQAPVISGNQTVITYYNGSVKNFTQNLKITDDLDGEIFESNVDYDDSAVDYNSLTQQSIKFTVSDSWGRQTTEEGQILIRSGLEKSLIELHPLNGAEGPVVELLFINNKITVQQQNSSTQQPNVFQRFVQTIMSFFSSDEGEADSSPSESKGLEITLFNQDTNTVRTRVLITDAETAQSELTKLHNQLIKVGDQLSIKAVGLDDEKKATLYQSIKIQGPIVNQQEDYTDGVKKVDSFDNVRFMISNQGFESIYNEAPKIYFQLDDVSYYLGDEVNFDYGLLIRDDHDGLINAGYNVELTGIYVNNQTNDNELASKTNEGSSVVLCPVTDNNYFLQIGGKYYPRDEGTYEFKYTVTDSWGRTSTATRAITLKNALSRNVMTFANVDSIKAMYIGFNMNDREINIFPVEGEAGKQLVSGNPGMHYFNFQIFGENGSQKTDEIQGVWDETIQSYINKLKAGLASYRFEYGDYIKIYAGHPVKFAISTIHSKDPLKISGTLVNGREDYSDGIDIASSITDSVFVITPYGLVSNYTDPFVQDDSRFEILSWTSPEKVAANLKIDRTNKNFSFVGERNTMYKAEEPNKTVFTVTLYDGITGQVKIQANAKGENKSKEDNNNEFYNLFNGQSWVAGDYLEISTEEPKRIAFRGNIIGGRENYSDGVDTLTNLSKARFILGNDGIRVVYMDPPVINGVQDYEIQKGTEGATKEIILERLKPTVNAVDVLTGEQLDVMINEDSFEFDVNQIGYYNVNYTASTEVSKGESSETSPESSSRSNTSVEGESGSDDSGSIEILSTTKSATITVYAVPQFELKNGGVIEMNSIENNTQAISRYLTELVTVTDEEDDAKGLTVNPVLTSNTLDPTKPGTYNVSYKAEDSDGHENTKEFTSGIQVVRTISVTVPVTVPFQVVTNLLGENGQQVDPQFIAANIKIQNNNPTPVAVYLKSFNVLNSSEANVGSIYDKLSLVHPTAINESSMTIQDSMTKMALGVYVKSGFEYDANNFEYKDSSITDSILPTGKPNKDGPIWLLNNGFDISYVPSILNSQDNATNQQPFYFGTLAPNTDDTDQNKAVLSFTSIFSNKAKVAGKSRAKFQMVLEFR